MSALTLTTSPGSPPSDSSASTRSCSSMSALSTSSSLASTFSDISQHPSTGARTHAFFSSPFTRDPHTSMPHSTSTPTPPRSLTADFFSTTPVPTPDPPRTTTTKTLLSAIHPSRIFPSRYTSRSSRDEDESPLSTPARKPIPDPLFLDFHHTDDHGSPVLSRVISDGIQQHSRELSSLSSNSSFSSSTHSSLALPEHTNPHRLPTPPPPSPHFPSEPTPRPPYLEPTYARDDEDNVPPPEDIELAPGCIITSIPPSISHPQISTPALTLTPPPDTTSFSAAAATNLASITSPPLSADNTQPNNAILHLIRPLGQGAFSSVWLAEDKSRVPLTLKSKKGVRDLRKKASLASLAGLSRSSSIRGITSASSVASISRHPSIEDKSWSALERDSSLRMRKFRAKVLGTRPVGFNTTYLDERHGEMGINEPETKHDEHPISATTTTLPLPPTTPNGGDGIRRKSSKRGRLVAVKMTPRRSILTFGSTSRSTKREREEEEERTRVGFVREAEVLKHISHPNITPLLEHLSTPSHHILVLPYLPGGDLLGLVNNDIAWSKLGENVLRRIWCELCKAVGWMHGVGLVHRDIKLENILLTTPAFASLAHESARPTLETLPIPPSPLIKLTDFGLSRFIEIDENGEGELLWTRCGSEAYAAPELVMGTGSVRAQAAKKRRGAAGVGARSQDGYEDAKGNSYQDVKGFYDARETDAWACGVVLYALVARRLPFGEGVGQSQPQSQQQQQLEKIGGDGAPGYRYGRESLMERRQWLMKIARGEYEWPRMNHDFDDDDGVIEEFVGQGLVNIDDVKRIVGRLLVRDPRKRARIMDLWDEEWMWGLGGGLALGMTEMEWRERERERMREQERSVVGLGIDFGGEGGGGDDMDFEVTIDVEDENEDEGFLNLPCDAEEGEGEEEECDDVDEVDGEEGWLLDQESIGSIARQEVV